MKHSWEIGHHFQAHISLTLITLIRCAHCGYAYEIRSQPDSAEFKNLASEFHRDANLESDFHIGVRNRRGVPPCDDFLVARVLAE